MARKEKTLTKDQISQVEALAACLTRKQIADYFGIAEKTFDNIRKRQPEIDTAYKKGRSKTIGDIANSLITKAKSGELGAMIFFLKTQAGWRETKEMDVSVKSDTPVLVVPAETSLEDWQNENK